MKPYLPCTFCEYTRFVHLYQVPAFNTANEVMHYKFQPITQVACLKCAQSNCLEGHFGWVQQNLVPERLMKRIGGVA